MAITLMDKGHQVCEHPCWGQDHQVKLYTRLARDWAETCFPHHGSCLFAPMAPTKRAPAASGPSPKPCAASRGALGPGLRGHGQRAERHLSSPVHDLSSPEMVVMTQPLGPLSMSGASAGPGEKPQGGMGQKPRQQQQKNVKGLGCCWIRVGGEETQKLGCLRVENAFSLSSAQGETAQRCKFCFKITRRAESCRNFEGETNPFRFNY